MSFYQLRSLRFTIAELLALAMRTIFPNIEYLEAEITDIGFSYTFYYPYPAHSDILILLEENIRALLKDFPLLEEVEMMRENVAGLFTYQGQKLKAEKILALATPTLNMLRFKDFYDLALYPLYQKSMHPSLQQAAFKLLAVKVFEKNFLKIEGTAFFEKRALKDFLKLRQQVLKQKPSFLFWFTEAKNPTLLVEGVKIIQGLQRIWENFLKEQHFSPVISNTYQLFELKKRHLAAYLQMAQGRLERQVEKGVGEWSVLDLTKNDFYDLNHFFGSYQEIKEACISCLQFIYKIINILSLRAIAVIYKKRSQYLSLKSWDLGLKCLLESFKINSFSLEIREETEAFFEKPRLEFCLYDALGQERTGPFLEIDFDRMDKLNEKGIAKQINGSMAFSLFGFRLAFLETVLKQRKEQALLELVEKIQEN